MKKFYFRSFFMIFCLAFLIAGCDKDDSGSKEKTPEPAGKTDDAGSKEITPEPAGKTDDSGSTEETLDEAGKTDDSGSTEETLDEAGEIDDSGSTAETPDEAGKTEDSGSTEETPDEAGKTEDSGSTEETPDEAGKTEDSGSTEETPEEAGQMEEEGKGMAGLADLATGGALMASETGAGGPENNEGVAHFKEGHWDISEKHFRKALEANDKFAEAHYNLALTLDKIGNHGDATNHFKMALELAPDNPKIKDSQILKDHVGG